MLNINRFTEHTSLLSAYQKRWDPKPNNVTVYSVEEHLESLSVMNPHQLPPITQIVIPSLQEGMEERENLTCE